MSRPKVRKSRLYSCLITIWYYAREYGDPAWRMPKYFRILFGDPNDMDVLSADDDARTKALALCVRSLVAANVVKGIHRRAKGPRASDGELVFLGKTFGTLWSPDISLTDRGPAELANLAALFEGLKKILSQNLPPHETLGPEVSKTVDVLTLSMVASLPAALPLKRWGSTESAVGHSRATLKRCLYAYQELRTTIHLGVPLQHPETLELVRRLKALDVKLASHADQYDLSQSPSQKYTEGGAPIVGIQIIQGITNDSVAQTSGAQHQQAPPSLDESPSSGGKHVRMPEPQHSLRFEEGPPMPVTPNYQ